MVLHVSRALEQIPALVHAGIDGSHNAEVAAPLLWRTRFPIMLRCAQEYEPVVGWINLQDHDLVVADFGFLHWLELAQVQAVMKLVPAVFCTKRVRAQ